MSLKTTNSVQPERIRVGSRFLVDMNQIPDNFLKLIIQQGAGLVVAPFQQGTAEQIGFCFKDDGFSVVEIVDRVKRQ